MNFKGYKINDKYICLNEYRKKDYCGKYNSCKECKYFKLK